MSHNLLQAPFLVQTDSYKAAHFMMYPQNIKSMTAYMECRGHLPESNDQRIVLFGIRYIIETLLFTKITLEDIREADAFFADHGVGATSYTWPRDLWISVVEENNGRLPFTIKALPDGSVIYPHVPFIEITAEGKYAPLVTWLETKLMHIWSPTTTATKSRIVKDMLKAEFEATVDPEFYFILDSRLHDFGYRGTSSQETAMVTGAAHLLSFNGTDTMPASWLATKWNEGLPVGESVLATEHSVMTSWYNEKEAVRNLLYKAKSGSIVSVVADSYSYSNFLYNILPEIAPLAKEKNILFVIRPDSGNPVDAVLDALNAAEIAFGSTVNKKGYKVLNGAAVIQGDGLDIQAITRVAEAVHYYGWSAQNVAYGMGGGLLQKQNRDTLKIAMKLSETIIHSGAMKMTVPVMKDPEGDSTKRSLPGRFSVRFYDECSNDNHSGSIVVYPSELAPNDNSVELLETIYTPSEGVIVKPKTFSHMRNRLDYYWERLPSKADPVSSELKEKQNQISLENKTIKRL